MTGTHLPTRDGNAVQAALTAVVPGVGRAGTIAAWALMLVLVGASALFANGVNRPRPLGPPPPAGAPPVELFAYGYDLLASGKAKEAPGDRPGRRGQPALPADD